MRSVDAAIPSPCDLPGASLTPACQAKDALGSAVSGIGGGILAELAGAVTAAVQQVLGAVLEFLAAPVRPDLSERWLGVAYDRVVTVSATFAALFLILGVARAILRGSLTDLGRVAGFTVAAFAGSGVALALTQAFIAVVDVATAQVAAGAPEDIASTFADLLLPLAALTATGPGGALLSAFFGVLAMTAAVAIYVELFLRNVMIHIVVYFLPLMLVGTIWAPTRRWARRAIEFLAVLILSKFVLYAVIALGWSGVTSLSAGQLATSWASVLTGIVLLLVAAYLPWLLFKLLPFMELQVMSGLGRRDMRAAFAAPMAPVSASMRTVEHNLRRASTLSAAGTAAAPLLASRAASAPRLAAGKSLALPATASRPQGQGASAPPTPIGARSADRTPLPVPPLRRQPDGDR